MAASASLGETPQDYQVFESLGKGGFAQVFRARCRLTGATVALKKIDKALMASKGMEGRVRQEVVIHSKLKHPAVLELFAFFEDKHYVYLVLELAHSGDLARFFAASAASAKGKGLSEATAANILRQIVDGVLYLHSHRIVHRDLSLNNLLLTRDFQVKIADFGLATQLNEPDEKHVTMCGTPNYISPEVASRSNHGLPADIWGIGCLLYTLLVGKPPFDTQQVKHTLNRVIRADYQLPRGLSVEARDLLERTLRKNPSERISLYEMAQHPFLNMQQALSQTRDSGFHTTLHTTRLSRSSSEEKRSASCDLFRERRALPTSPKKTASFNVLAGIENCNHDPQMKNSRSSSNRLEDIFSIKNSHEYDVKDHYCNFNLPPLCTDRLSEITHRTRNVEISILPDRSIGIKIIKKRGRHREERVTETCSISKDGMDIAVHAIEGGKGVPLASPMLSFAQTSTERFSYPDIPEKHRKKYAYAVRFVDLVKAQTAKVTFYSERAKCHMMENGTDFKVTFYDGGKIVLQAGKGVKIFDRDDRVYCDLTDLNGELLDMYDCFLELTGKCRELESALNALSKSSALDYFPIMVGGRPQHSTVSKTGNGTSPQITPTIPSASSLNMGSFCRSSATNSNFLTSSRGFDQLRTFNPNGEVLKMRK